MNDTKKILFIFGIVFLFFLFQTTYRQHNIENDVTEHFVSDQPETKMASKKLKFAKKPVPSN